MISRVLLGLFAVVVATLVLGWMAPLHPLFEAVTNVRAQLVPPAVVLVVGFAAVRNWPLVGASALVLALCLSYVVPYWLAHPDPVPVDGSTVRIMQYNLFFGNDDYPAIAAHVEAADAAVVVLHEVTPEQWTGLEPLLSRHPHHIAAPLDETQGQLGGGMVMISQTPLQRMTVASEVSPSDRVVIAATTMLQGRETMVIGLHPFASRNQSRKASLRETQLAGVVELTRSAAMPALIVADLNVAPTSPQYRQFVRDLEWRDPHRVVGWQSTWPTWGGPFGIPIDHVFVSNEFALHGYHRGDGAGSDHLSVVAEVSFKPIAGS